MRNRIFSNGRPGWRVSRERRMPASPPPQPGVAIVPGRPYGSGVDDATLDAIVARIGGASIHDNDLWGPNADQLHLLHEAMAAGEVNAHLIGHETRATLADLYREVEHALVHAQDVEQRAFADTDEHTLAAVEREELGQRIKDEGLAFPHWIAHSLLYALALLGLVFGDLTFIATAFQIFGLSDAQLFGFIPFSDPLHVAASASVGALVVLAHVAGKRLREVGHDVDRRRRASDPNVRERLPAPSWFSAVIAFACIAGAGGLLTGIAMVRVGYLAATGVNAQAWSFALIQAGVFLAALALAIGHAHPHGREWIDLSRRTARAAKQMLASSAAHAETVGRVNALIDQGNAILAQAGHHLGASTADVARQIARIGWMMPLYQPEPVSENRLLPDALPQPEELSRPETAAFLIGITGLPVISRVSTDRVTQHREKARALIERLRMARVKTRWPDDAEPDESAPGSPRPEAGSELIGLTAPPATAAATNGGGPA
jgi:hypothetical protein